MLNSAKNEYFSRGNETLFLENETSFHENKKCFRRNETYFVKTKYVLGLLHKLCHFYFLLDFV